jgi:hypothetical protein
MFGKDEIPLPAPRSFAHISKVVRTKPQGWKSEFPFGPLTRGALLPPLNSTISSPKSPMDGLLLPSRAHWVIKR